MTLRTLASSIFAIAVAATVARADSDTPDPFDHPTWRLAGAIGMRMGTFFVDGKDTGTDVPGYVLLGVRHGRLLLAGEYDLMSVVYPHAQISGDASTLTAFDPGDGRGLLQRIGATARWGFGHVGTDGSIADLYVEGGPGIERWEWDAGGVWWRPDLSVGFGTELMLFGAQAHGGLSMGFRFTFAQRDHVAASSGCDGPCTYPTPPTGIDRSVMFDMGLVFGR